MNAAIKKIVIELKNGELELSGEDCLIVFEALKSILEPVSKMAHRVASISRSGETTSGKDWTYRSPKIEPKFDFDPHLLIKCQTSTFKKSEKSS